MRTPGNRVMRTPGNRVMRTPGNRVMRTPRNRVMRTPATHARQVLVPSLVFSGIMFPVVTDAVSVPLGGPFMTRVAGGALVLVLLVPALWGEDKPKDKDKAGPTTPAEEYKALLDEHRKAQTAFFQAVGAAKTQEDRLKLFREKNPTSSFAPKFLALAEKHPKDPVAVDALVWVVSNNPGRPAGKESTRAVEILLRDHVQSDKMGKVCQSLTNGMDQAGETLLRAVMEKNKNKEVQAEACLALAQRLQQRGSVLKMVKDNAEMAKRVEDFYGKDFLKGADLAKVEAESASLFKLLAEKHLGSLSLQRLQNLCQRLSFSGSKSSEGILRALLEKDSRRDVQGVACLTLAQVLKRHAEGLAGKDAKEAKKAQDEAEKLFERAADKFADVKQGFRGTIGEQAKGELFDLRFLSVGKSAPDVEGEDQDGKKFKLSDYKGKVVFLDFWSQY
jgi:hypothetical protein